MRRSLGGISPPPQALRGKTVGHVWRSKEACEIPHRPELAKHLRYKADIYARYGGDEAPFPRRPGLEPGPIPPKGHWETKASAKVPLPTAAAYGFRLALR